MQHHGLTRYAWLSILTAILIILLKVSAYLLTGSIGFLSDAMESGANILAAIFTLGALIVAARPPDTEHTFGHSKAEYLSSGAEGSLILIAAVVIGVQAFERLFSPQPLEQVGLGVVISAVAALANFLVARVLMRAGKRYRSMALTADARHLLTDVWTSLGVIVGVVLVSLTGRLWLDPVIGLVVAAQIVYTGLKLIRVAINGLLDASLPDDELAMVVGILQGYEPEGVAYHALRTRQAGAQRFVSFHLLVPGTWSVQRGHELLERIERDIRRKLEPVSIISHLEPREDPVSLDDDPLFRED